MIKALRKTVAGAELLNMRVMKITTMEMIMPNAERAKGKKMAEDLKISAFEVNA
jgi:hypothetical protein